MCSSVTRSSVSVVRALWFATVTVTATPSAGLWGSAPNGKSFVKIDPLSGSERTTKCTSCANNGVLAAVSAVAGNVFFTVRTRGIVEGHIFLHGFDVSTGKTAVKIDIPQFVTFAGTFGSGCFALAAKPNSTVVYALGPTGKKNNPAEHSLFAIDTATEKTVLIGTTVAAKGVTMHSTFDAKGGILYFQYQDNAGGMNIKGISISNASTTFDSYSPLYTFDFDPKTRLLYGVALEFNPPEQYRSLASLDVASGKTKTLLNLTNYAENLPASTFSHQNRTLSSILLPQNQESASLVTVNVDSLSVVSGATLCAQFDSCPRNLEWVQ